MTPTHTSAVDSPAVRIRLFFDQTSKQHFLVLAELLDSLGRDATSQFTVQTFEHEDRFLDRLIAAELPPEDTTLVAATVIRSIDQTDHSQPWPELTMSHAQRVVLGLDGRPFSVDAEEASVAEFATTQRPFEFADDASQFYQFLMRSPTPFAMLPGPEHRFAFINQSYVELIGQTTQQDVLMSRGIVYGVMIQAAEVTETVQTERASRAREEHSSSNGPSLMRSTAPLPWVWRWWMGRHCNWRA
jgi:hypothetical protein